MDTRPDVPRGRRRSRACLWLTAAAMAAMAAPGPPAAAAAAAGAQAAPVPPAGRIEAPQDWDPIGRHVLYLLQESDTDFALLRGEQVNDHMWLSTHYIGSPLRADDPVPPSVIVLQGYTAWFHGTPLSYGTRRQMTHEMLSQADDIERTTAGAMEREDIEDMYVRFTACALGSDKYVLLSNLPRVAEVAPVADGEDASGDGTPETGAVRNGAEGGEVEGREAADEAGDAAEYEVTLMVGRQPGLC